MLGMFHILPLLKGWEYKVHRLERWVNRGADPLSLSILERGWLISLTELTNDCYATCRIEWQGADLQTRTFEGNPQSMADIGGFLQDPAGWLQRYFRPNPASTAGMFALIIMSGGFHGALLPYIPTVKLSMYLPLDSTQTQAYIGLAAEVVAITDVKTFIQSLRSVLAIKDLKIDPALLTIGPAQFKEEK